MVTPILPLEIQGAHVRRGGRRILGPLDYTLHPGGLTMVLGPNGSGKTTFLRLLHGLERLREGELRWAAGEKDLRAAQAFVFQSPIIMRRSVRDNIAYPLRVAGHGRTDARALAAEMAAKVGLAERLDIPAQSLSGGEKQKMALARALVRAPQLLFLDEPCANLDMHSTREIEHILHDVRASGTTIVMSTHNIGQARRLADGIVFLHHGMIVESGLAGEVLAQPRTPQAAAFFNGELIA